MTSSGRKPKSTKLKLVSGNPGKRPLNPDEPKYDPLDLKEKPDGMPEVADQIWDEYAGELEASKVLTVVDRHVFQAFCINYAMWLQAVKELLDEGIPLVESARDGYKKNPKLTAMTELQKNWERVGATLGLDPSSRSRLSVPGTHGKDNPFGGRRRKQ